MMIVIGRQWKYGGVVSGVVIERQGLVSFRCVLVETSPIIDSSTYYLCKAFKVDLFRLP